MATLVFYGGAGINVIFYCCNQCRSAGIEALLKKDNCCKTHHYNHNHAADKHEPHSGHSCCTKADQDCCGTHNVKSNNYCTDHTSGNCCNIERIHFDWNTQNAAELNIDLSPVTFDLSLFPDILTINVLICETGAVMPKGPPLACPRDYLSRLTILLI